MARLPEGEQIVPLERVLGYATRLSEHFCRRALSYYTVLRDPNAEASERSSRRAALHSDLRNWNLLTGAVTPETADEHTTTTPHNWDYFAGFWEKDERGLAPAGQRMLPTS